jgi:uncharacterized protein
MTEINGPVPGSFCWIELATSDAPGAKAFYTDVFGWTVQENDMGEMGTYFIFQKNGRDAAAMYELMPEQKAQGVPPSWLSYVAVTSADESAAQAESLGATLIRPVFDVSDLGRMALLRDPQGAVFATWEAKKQWGLGIRNEASTLCWNELATKDPDAAREFYTKLTGWTAKGSPEYTEWHREEEGIGGMRAIAAGDPTPPNWMPYFLADDCDASTAKAAAGGARTFMPPTTMPDVGRFSVLADPQGAVFALFEQAKKP